MDISQTFVLEFFPCLFSQGRERTWFYFFFSRYNPWATYKVLERRSNLGGTWDLFRYPGIRSDSDMFTFGFSWKVWKSPKAIAPGEDILAYLTEAAKEHGIIDHIR